MQVIIPMAGRGDRFRNAGYERIKPLIEVDGKPMIEHVIGLFPGEHDFLFICASDHLESTSLAATLSRVAPRGETVGIPPHKLGPVHTVLAAEEKIRDDEPVLLSYCDFSLRWDYAAFLAFVRATGCDGALPSYRGFHPHSLGPGLYGYLKMQGDRVEAVREKSCFTDDKMQEFASTGIYYFKSGALLRKYFRLAKERDMRVKGEFFASLPYNALIEDGGDVRVFEVQRFLQWGTPEDLREYQGWSDYFARASGVRPKPMTQRGLTLVPMAGEGKRFRDAGIDVPKPLIPIDGVPMIERSLASLPRTDRSVVVCQASVDEGPRLRRALRATGRDVSVVALAGPTDGAVRTCLAAETFIRPDEPLLIAACDAALIHDEQRFLELSRDISVDYVVWTFTDHPHANRNPKQYAWVRANDGGGIEALLCKQPLREGDVRADPGVTGAFWFRKGLMFLEGARDLIASGEKVNREFYVDSVVALLARKGLRGRILETRHFICFGTPEDVRTYEYWAAHFREIARARERVPA